MGRQTPKYRIPVYTNSIHSMTKPSSNAESDCVTVQEIELDHSRSLINYLRNWIDRYMMEFGKRPKGIVMGAKDWLDLCAEISQIRMQYYHDELKNMAFQKEYTFEGIPITIAAMANLIVFSIDHADSYMHLQNKKE